MQSRQRQLLYLAAIGICIPLSFSAAPYPRELVLQHIPTAIGLLLLFAIVWRRNTSESAITCCVLFLALHLIGARWIYSYVPYDEWSEALLGVNISETFGWKRNHYDRLVHFASGLLGISPIAAVLMHVTQVKNNAAIWLSVMAVLAIGAGYEIVEWQIAVILSPEMAESYNGQQGDIWDPQKDMALAGLGAIFSATVLHMRNLRSAT